MANIPDETIEYVANSAKLELSEEEKEQAKKDMNMLDYIDTLNELDTSGVEPISRISSEQQRLREDVVTNEDDRDEILANVPEAKDGAFVVPKTFDQEERYGAYGFTAVELKEDAMRSIRYCECGYDAINAQKIT